MPDEATCGTSERTHVSQWVLGLPATGAALLTVAALEVFSPTLALTGPVFLWSLPAIVVVAAVFAGPVAVVGAVVGYVGYQLYHGAVAFWPTLGYLAFGFALCAFLETSGPGPPNRSTAVSARWLSRFFAVVAVASLYLGVMTAWGYELTGQFSFFPTSVFLAVNAFLSAALFGGLGAVTLTQSATVMQYLSWSRNSQSSFKSLTDSDQSWPRVLVFVPVAWFLLGNGISVGFHIVERISAIHFRRRGFEPLLMLKRSPLVGQPGSGIQVALGAAAVTVLVLVVLRWQLSRLE
ncbi:hypothetical protein NDI54_17325 [Haloarcula sp. S1AR25-5A]|uniref:Uncharacterized protein n=1 Tax=Haloarcula terrestris TaxID=2950533 RepID=A0AAE4EZM8_9EURY|nr:hypothetical protein [Haloarcula terrestris]MDS0223110.1 hypothetical protein [Haloarcula terrestris]